jgi:hypothetical protein
MSGPLPSTGFPDQNRSVAIKIWLLNSDMRRRGFYTFAAGLRMSRAYCQLPIPNRQLTGREANCFLCLSIGDWEWAIGNDESAMASFWQRYQWSSL